MILCIIHWKIAKTDTYFHFKPIIIFYLTLLLSFIYNTLILHGDKSCISMVFLKPQNMHTSLIQNWGFVVLVALDWDIDRPSSWDHVMDLTLEMLWMRLWIHSPYFLPLWPQIKQLYGFTYIYLILGKDFNRTHRIFVILHFPCSTVKKSKKKRNYLKKLTPTVVFKLSFSFFCAFPHNIIYYLLATQSNLP